MCCVALTRTRAGGFGADIPAGQPCGHLQRDDRCGIHDRLRSSGWPACTVFDCFGAGQRVTQVTFGGRAHWHDDPATAREMFEVFGVMRHLMEMLRLLTEATSLAEGSMRRQIEELARGVDALTRAPAAEVAAVDVDAVRAQVGPLLVEVSESARRPVPRSSRFVPRADLIGADLAGQDLSRHSLRSALLIAADLRRARLARTDLLGADLRDADLSGADLREAFFVTQPQIDAARGDARTRLPEGIIAPSHWN